MTLNIIEYIIDIDGISPSIEKFGGTQGDHRVTTLKFYVNDSLFNEIVDNVGDGKAMYRFDIYDGEGGVWSSDSAQLTEKTVSVELEERHTRHGGKITAYFVITELSADDETEMELYSFPAVIRLKNRPEGVYQNDENYESITTLAESAKSNALAAEKTNQELQIFAAEIEEKLKNGEFDGVGVETAEIINDELIIEYTDGAMQNLGNVKGEKGDIGPRGEKGDAGKDAVTEQSYSPTSENAQSGKAVAQAVSDRIPKITVEGHTASFKRAIALTAGEAGDALHGTDDEDYATVDIAPYGTAELTSLSGAIATYGNGGRLNVYTPIDDYDCANKGYVDELVGDIESLLGGI